MLHTQTVEPNTLGLLKRLMADETLRSFNLVGGTALSLQIGHRKSIDLDLFTQSDFVGDDILQHLLANGYSPQVRHVQKQTLIVEIEGIKVDFIRFRYPFAYDILLWEDIRLADIRDIACMKIDAIMGRGKKKDFCDLYFLLQRFSLKDMMTWYANMFQHSTLFHVFKSLTWFEDANLEGELDVFDETYDWEKAKETIVKAVEKTI
jgi:Nucleotidyl transferase AbiEii toxin, Type IV TA system